MINRREFLRHAALTSGLVAFGATAPRFLAKTAAAQGANAPRSGSKDTILIVVQLTGGNDGLNTVIPFKNELYEKYRPTLKLPTEQLKKIDDSHGMHPSLDGFGKLLEDRALCVVQGVGYPNPSQSHFRSMDIWQAASLAEELNEGWLGKAMGRMKSNGTGFHLAMPNEASWLSLTGAPVKVPSITSLEEYTLKMSASSGVDRREQKNVIEGAAKVGEKPPALLDFIQRTAVNTYASTQRLQEIGKNYQPKVPYPATGLGNRLKLAAQLIEADLGARIYYVSIDGFDTHATQLNAHANLLKEVGDAMTACFQDLAARGHRDRVLMMTFSEFGRRAKENGSKGTDHGSAAPMFLIGGKVKPGLVGAHPTLEKLEQGNLVHHTDFRQVYAAILDQWLGVPAKEVLGGAFKPIDVLSR
jgi:uncharacterized protein (DUF1501 family)